MGVDLLNTASVKWLFLKFDMQFTGVTVDIKKGAMKTSDLKKKAI